MESKATTGKRLKRIFAGRGTSVSRETHGTLTVYISIDFYGAMSSRIAPRNLTFALLKNLKGSPVLDRVVLPAQRKRRGRTAE
jgi:hypothetical protein